MIEITKKKKKALAAFLVAVLCLSVAGITGIEKAKEKEADSDIPLHDGDILVDSLSINKVSGSSINTENTEETGMTALVTSDDLSELSNSDAYFEELRATVTMDRNQILSMLTEVIEEAESAVERENATQQKLKIIEYMDKEQIIEKLIDTKGLPECIVLITDNAVNVTVAKQDLTQSEVAKICDIIIRESGRNISEIIIQSKY